MSRPSYSRLVNNLNLPAPSAQGVARLDRQATLDRFLRAYEVEQLVERELEVLNKGRILKALLLVVPVATTAISVVGGLYTVYSSSDCQGTRFAAYSRAFLYTSISWTLVNVLMNQALSSNLRRLMANPGAAFAAYCGQAGVTLAFFGALLALFVMVLKTACPTVKAKVKTRL